MINFVWLEKVHMISPPSLFILHGVLQIWLDLLQYSVQGFSLYPTLGLVFGFSEQTKAFDIIHGSSLRVNRDVIRIANKITGGMYLCKLDILFLSNHNIHKSSCGLCFWASDPLIDGF